MRIHSFRNRLGLWLRCCRRRKPFFRIRRVHKLNNLGYLARFIDIHQPAVLVLVWSIVGQESSCSGAPDSGTVVASDGSVDFEFEVLHDILGTIRVMIN